MSDRFNQIERNYAFLWRLRAFFESIGDDAMTSEHVEIARAIIHAWTRRETGTA